VNGNEIWYNPAESNEMAEKNEKGVKVANMKFWDAAGRALDKRIAAINTLVTDISAADFCKNNIGADISLDTDRLISAGQSYGG